MEPEKYNLLFSWDIVMYPQKTKRCKVLCMFIAYIVIDSVWVKDGHYLSL